MFTIRKKLFCLVLAAALMVVGGFGNVNKASAAASGALEQLIPYSVIGTNEYNLPVGFDKPINLLLSYNVWANINQNWDADRDEVTGDRSIVASVNKFARLFTIDGIDNWGFLWEAILPLASITDDDGANSSGLLDPQTGVVAWTKPVPNWTTCFEYWLHLPFGDDNLTQGAVSHTFAWMNNHQLFDSKIVVDWDVFYKFRGDGRLGTGAKYDLGDTLGANVVVSYMHSPWFNPNLHFDYDTTGNSEGKAGAADLSSSDNMQVGIGNSMRLTSRLLLDVWYARGIDGRNAPKTNNIYTRLIWSF